MLLHNCIQLAEVRPSHSGSETPKQIPLNVQTSTKNSAGSVTRVSAGHPATNSQENVNTIVFTDHCWENWPEITIYAL